MGRAPGERGGRRNLRLLEFYELRSFLEASKKLVGGCGSTWNELEVGDWGT